MDKTVHKKVLLTEGICLFIGIICIWIGVLLHYSETMPGMVFYRMFLSVVGILCEFVVVSIELFLFHLEEKKYKFITIGYYILECIFIMIFNILFPFLGLFVVISFNILKNTYRYNKVEVIYKRLGYYELCKKFGIKVKRPRKPRTAVTKKTTVPVKKAGRNTTAKEPTYA